MVLYWGYLLFGVGRFISAEAFMCIRKFKNGPSQAVRVAGYIDPYAFPLPLLGHPFFLRKHKVVYHQRGRGPRVG